MNYPFKKMHYSFKNNSTWFIYEKVLSRAGFFMICALFRMVHEYVYL